MTHQSSFDDIFDEEFSPSDRTSELSSEDNPHYSLVDSEDKWILMHREAHFSGNFEWMLSYYREEALGADPDISLQRIVELMQLEAQGGENLASLLLDGADAERIAECKEAYKNLRDICESHDLNAPPCLLAELILSEEEHPITEIRAITALGDKAIPLLLPILNSSTFCDTLGPGYGQAPKRAIRCLGLLKATEAIEPLFALLKEEQIDLEEDIHKAFLQIGTPAKAFLLRALSATPLSKENERAIIALIGFQDSEVANLCFKLLSESFDSLPKTLRSYCLLGCEFLQNSKDQEAFAKLGEKLSSDEREDHAMIMRNWKQA